MDTICHAAVRSNDFNNPPTTSHSLPVVTWYLSVAPSKEPRTCQPKLGSDSFASLTLPSTAMTTGLPSQPRRRCCCSTPDTSAMSELADTADFKGSLQRLIRPHSHNGSALSRPFCLQAAHSENCSRGSRLPRSGRCGRRIDRLQMRCGRRSS